MEAFRKVLRETNWRNFWDYHKWYVIGGALLIIFLFRRVGSALGWFETKPDIQVAYVGKQTLPEDTLEAAQGALALLCPDLNGDGKVRVVLHSYAEGMGEGASDEGLYRYGMEIALLGDIQDAESYLFLLEDPKDFQKRYQVLAASDGSVPADTDLSVEEKVVLWSEVEKLSSLDLGSYRENVLGMEQTGENQELLSPLYLGRRCFPGEKTVENREGCDAFWESLMEGES